MVDRIFSSGVSESDFDQAQGSKFVTIPPADGKTPKVGDSIYLLVECGVATEKKAGVSLNVPLTVVEDDENYGKTVDWYPSIGNKDGIGITKEALLHFKDADGNSITDKVIVRANGRIGFNPNGFAGARARALFVREMSMNNNLRSVLNSASFLDPLPTKTETKPEETTNDPNDVFTDKAEDNTNPF